MRQPRTVGLLCISLFAVSSLFPLVAGVTPLVQRFPPVGPADGIIAFALVGGAIALISMTRTLVTDQHRLDAFRMMRAAASLIIVLLAAFFVAGDRIDWSVLIVGLAWRAWLFVYAAPNLLAALQYGVTASTP